MRKFYSEPEFEENYCGDDLLTLETIKGILDGYCKKHNIDDAKNIDYRITSVGDCWNISCFQIFEITDVDQIIKLFEKENESHHDEITQILESKDVEINSIRNKIEQNKKLMEGLKKNVGSN